MSRYRWLRPSKCLETMEFFPALKDQAYEARQKLLFDAVARGDVRVMINDELVPKAHIGIYLSLYARATPQQEPFTIPPDTDISYDDLCAVFDRPSIDNRKRGRPVKAHSGWSEDRRLAFEMHMILAGRPEFSRAKSAAEAARMLVSEGKASGVGTPESIAKRLERAFRRYYASS
jgi:hypothetical protein